MAPAGKLVGIDLGTTFSAIATLDERGQAVVLPNQEGEMLTPSVVFLEGNTAVVGAAARDAALEQPGQVASLIKRSEAEGREIVKVLDPENFDVDVEELMKEVKERGEATERRRR